MTVSYWAAAARRGEGVSVVCAAAARARGRSGPGDNRDRPNRKSLITHVQRTQPQGRRTSDTLPLRDFGYEHM